VIAHGPLPTRWRRDDLCPLAEARTARTVQAAGEDSRDRDPGQRRRWSTIQMVAGHASPLIAAEGDNALGSAPNADRERWARRPGQWRRVRPRSKACPPVAAQVGRGSWAESAGVGDRTACAEEREGRQRRKKKKEKKNGEEGRGANVSRGFAASPPPDARREGFRPRDCSPGRPGRVDGIVRGRRGAAIRAHGPAPRQPGGRQPHWAVPPPLGEDSPYGRPAARPARRGRPEPVPDPREPRGPLPEGPKGATNRKVEALDDACSKAWVPARARMAESKGPEKSPRFPLAIGRRNGGLRWAAGWGREPEACSPVDGPAPPPTLQRTWLVKALRAPRWALAPPSHGTTGDSKRHCNSAITSRGGPVPQRGACSWCRRLANGTDSKALGEIAREGPARSGPSGFPWPRRSTPPELGGRAPSTVLQTSACSGFAAFHRRSNHPPRLAIQFRGGASERRGLAAEEARSRRAQMP